MANYELIDNSSLININYNPFDFYVGIGLYAVKDTSTLSHIIDMADDKYLYILLCADGSIVNDISDFFVTEGTYDLSTNGLRVMGICVLRNNSIDRSVTLTLNYGGLNKNLYYGTNEINSISLNLGSLIDLSDNLYIINVDSSTNYLIYRFNENELSYLYDIPNEWSQQNDIIWMSGTPPNNFIRYSYIFNVYYRYNTTIYSNYMFNGELNRNKIIDISSNFNDCLRIQVYNKNNIDNIQDICLKIGTLDVSTKCYYPIQYDVSTKIDISMGISTKSSGNPNIYGVDDDSDVSTDDNDFDYDILKYSISGYKENILKYINYNFYE